MISAKSTVSNVSASINTSNMSIPSAVPVAVATTTVTTSHRDYTTTPLMNRSHSPRGHSPTRERDSYRFVIIHFLYLMISLILYVIISIINIELWGSFLKRGILRKGLLEMNIQ